MATYTNEYLAEKRRKTAYELVRFQYQRNGSSQWRDDATINKKVVEGDRVIIDLHFPCLRSTDKITKVRFFDNRGIEAGVFDANLSRRDDQTGLCRLSLYLTEI